MSIEVVPEEIRLASARMADVVGEVRDVRPASGVRDVHDALPGSMSSGAAAELVDVWTSRFTNWADDSDEHRHALEIAAIAYREEDERAARDAEDLRRALGLPAPYSQPEGTLPRFPGNP